MFYDHKKPNCQKFDEIKAKSLVIYTREAQKNKKKPVELTAEQALKKKIVPNEWMTYFLAKEFEFYQSLGIPKSCLRFRNMLKEETPHYSLGNFDLEIKFDFGWKETVGNAIRTDYDLKKHMQFSKKDLTVLTDDGRKITPYVVEPSFGVERTIAGILLHCFVEDKKRGWNWFKFPVKIAPYAVAVFPLVNRDNLPKIARKIYCELKKDFDVFYDGSGSIGRRYARADEVGTPFSITIDYESLEDNSCTIRDRDTTRQVRVKIDDLSSVLNRLMNGEVNFEKVGKLIK